VVLFGSDEWEYTVRLERVERDSVHGTVEARTRGAAEPGCDLTLAFACLKGEKTEWVIQKGTELGVTRFLLVQTRRTVALPDERRAAGRLERYARIAREATEQCGRIRPPRVEGVYSLDQALAASGEYTGLILHERATRRVTDHLHEMEMSETEARGSASDDRVFPRIRLFVGPEGGFGEEEVALAVDHGLQAVTLGLRVLRSETAALAAVALTMDVLDR
jgi:16S rRNA (uracil1498-N3)-methyltransferase